jgi:hypothetical protein
MEKNKMIKLWSRVLLENINVAQLNKEFPVFHRNENV